VGLVKISTALYKTADTIEACDFLYTEAGALDDEGRLTTWSDLTGTLNCKCALTALMDVTDLRQNSTPPPWIPARNFLCSLWNAETLPEWNDAQSSKRGVVAKLREAALIAEEAGH
jgi:hypothetical protein